MSKKEEKQNPELLLPPSSSRKQRWSVSPPILSSVEPLNVGPCYWQSLWKGYHRRLSPVVVKDDITLKSNPDGWAIMNLSPLLVWPFPLHQISSESSLNPLPSSYHYDGEWSVPRNPYSLPYIPPPPVQRDRLLTSIVLSIVGPVSDPDDDQDNIRTESTVDSLLSQYRDD